MANKTANQNLGFAFLPHARPYGLFSICHVVDTKVFNKESNMIQDVIEMETARRAFQPEFLKVINENDMHNVREVLRVTFKVKL